MTAMMTTTLPHPEAERPRLTYTVEEAARIIGIGRSAAYKAANAGEIPTIRIGRKLLVPVRRLEQMLGAPAATEANSRA